MAELARAERHTVGGVCSMVFADIEASRGAGRSDGLRRIDIDVTGYKKGRRYVSVVVDRGTYGGISHPSVDGKSCRLSW